jgi:hypothetical protein
MQAEVTGSKVKRCSEYGMLQAATYTVIVERHTNLTGCMRVNNGFMLT